MYSSRNDAHPAPPDIRPRRRVAALVAVATAVAAAVGGTTLPGSPADAAFGNSLTFSNGADKITVGPNSGIYVDGTLDYDDYCVGEGVVNDFLYPASDVYIVPTGGFAGPLEDAAGNGPNTIVATATGLFIGEPIAFTSPGGTLGAGVYDVIIDTCQDGMFDGEDAIYFEAITVEMPDGDLPPASDAIRRIKDREKQLGEFWLQAHDDIALMFKVDKAKAVLECLLMPSPECLSKMLLVLNDRDTIQANFNNHVETLVLGLIMNVAKNHSAIWQDPPDADVEHLPVLEPTVVDEVPAGGVVHDAFAELLAPLADEAAITEAYLHAIERYQGAQSAGDAEWALVHARAARDLSETLREQYTSSTALADLRDAIADPANDVLANFTTGRQFVGRVRQGGFTGDERRHLANQGLSDLEVNALEATIAGLGTIPVHDQSSLLTTFDDLLAARAAAGADFAASEADWAAVVAALEARVTAAVPTAHAGGPYAANGPVTLDASASTTPSGSTITAFDWDLDGDGEFDDATGASPTTTFERDGTHVVSVRVTNDTGRAAVDHATVVVTGGDRPPVLTATSPARSATAVVAQPTTFSVTAADPDGDVVEYRWTVDGQPAGTGPTFTWTPVDAEIGHHVVAVEVGTTGRPRTAQTAWRVAVTTVDDDGDGWTATPDCDDSRADVNPGRVEVLGNELDDDCDAGTADAPPGGLTGAFSVWGHSSGLGVLTSVNRNLPAFHPTLTEVVDVDSTFGGGIAILPNGQLRTWGPSGVLGSGSVSASATPVTPLGVGGAPGTVLTDVVQVSSQDAGVIALRQDGSVVAWGDNVNRQVGDMSDVNTRLYPVEVVDANGDPVTGAVQVEQGQSTNYIVKADGTVWATGVQRCMGVYDGWTGYPKTDHAVQQTLWGDDVVQIAAGHGFVVARKADGSLWSCGSDQPDLGRGSAFETMQQRATPKPMTGFGPTNRAVDVSVGMSTGVALTEDGTVWMWGRNINGPMNAFGVAQDDVRYVAIPGDLPAGEQVVDVDHDDSPTVMARRVDGSVVIWGGNYFGSIGNGTWSPNPAIGFHTLDLGGTAVGVSVSTWNATAVVRPLDEPDWERPLPWIGAAVADAVIGESTGGAFTVTFDQPLPDAVSFDWSFDGSSGTVAVPAGTSTVDVPVAVTDDDVDEDDEELTFTIDRVSNGVNIVRGTAVGTVVDDDAAPVVTLTDAEVLEGATSLTDAVVRVHLSRPSGRDVVVHLATADGTAVAGQDYVAADVELLVPAGTTSADLHLTVRGDEVVEPHETLSVSIVDVVGGEPGAAGATLTVVDDEPIVVVVDAPTVVEGDAGTTPAVFELTVTPPPAGTTVTLPWSVVAGTAEVPTDVLAADGVVELGAGETTAQVTATVVADDVVEVEPTEFFRLRFGVPSASDGRPVVVADARLATVVDDDVEVVDEAPVVSAGDDVTGPEDAPVPVTGSVTDDGQVTTTWSTSVPGCVIADPTALVTTVTCADPGVATLTLTADDGVNPPVSDDVQVTVTPVVPPTYQWGGFYQPVDVAAVNTVRAGRAIPLKFSLGGDHGLDIFAPGSPSSVRIACDSGAAVDEIEQTVTAGSSSLTYDPGTGRYQYVWKTQTSWAGQCRQLSMVLDDGSVHTAVFRFR